jgi:hypothetical protein
MGLMGSQRFRAVIAAGLGDTAVITMPFDPDEAWGAKANHPVGGTIDGWREPRKALAVRQRMDFDPGSVTMTVTPRTSTNCTRHSDTTPSHAVPALEAFTTARCRSLTRSPAPAMPVHYPGTEDIATTNGTVRSCPIRARSDGQIRALTVTHGTNAKPMTCISAARARSSRSPPSWDYSAPTRKTGQSRRLRTTPQHCGRPSAVTSIPAGTSQRRLCRSRARVRAGSFRRRPGG